MNKTNRSVSLRAACLVVLVAMLLGAVGGVVLAARNKGLSSRGLAAVAAAAAAMITVFAVGRMLRGRGVRTPARVSLQSGLAIVIGVVAAWLLRH